MEEKLEGFIVDADCVRRWPLAELKERARKHTVTCALSGQSIESGYVLVDDQTIILDVNATPMIITALRNSDYERGVRIRMVRRMHEREIETTMVELAIPREPVESSNIRSVGWRDQTLEIEFKNSGVYQFLDVPKDVYQELMTADSHGRYFNQRVKKQYPSRKIE